MKKKIVITTTIPILIIVGVILFYSINGSEHPPHKKGDSVESVKAYIGRRKHSVQIIEVRWVWQETRSGNKSHPESIKIDTVSAKRLEMLYYDQKAQSAFPPVLVNFKFNSFEKLIFAWNKDWDATTPGVDFFVAGSKYIIALRSGFMGIPYVVKAALYEK